MWKHPDKQFRICSMYKQTSRWVDECQYYNDLSLAILEARRKSEQFRYRIFVVQDKQGVVFTIDGDTEIEINPELYKECYV